MKITDEILKFERENNMFDILDKDDFCVWEMIRYAVNTQLLRQSPSETQSNGFNSSLLFAVRRIGRFLMYFLAHLKCRTLLIINSRNIKDGNYYNVIADDLYEIANKKDVYIIETTNNWDTENYKYGKVCPSIITLLYRLNKKSYDFRKIISVINQKFPNVDVSPQVCLKYYRQFYTQYTFYKWFFKLTKFDRIIYTQNGIYKGLIAAAKEKNVRTIELQHAQISRNHFSYSYPAGVSNVYNPDFLMTLGPFWLKDAIFPKVNIIPLGNSSYNNRQNCTNIDSKRSILVVSSIIHYQQLKQLVRDISFIEGGFQFYYKLHPDEYKSYLQYVSYFSDLPNVVVVKNEQTIDNLLQIVEISLVVQSTVMVESLNAGKRVFVYKIQDYEVMDFLYGEPGISFIDNAQSFVEQYNNLENEVLPVGKFFMPFDRETGAKVLAI